MKLHLAFILFGFIALLAVVGPLALDAIVQLQTAAHALGN